MPDITKELIAYLKEKPAVTDLIGVGAQARIYQELAKQSVVAPFIVIETFQGSSFECLNVAAGVAINRLQINCYGMTADSAFELAEAVKLAPLQMYKGPMAGADCRGVVSDASYRKGYDPAVAGGNQKRYWVARDYEIAYMEEVPEPPPTSGIGEMIISSTFIVD